MTKKLRAILLVMIFVFLAGSCVALIPPKTEEPTVDAPIEDPFSFSIGYRSIVDGEEKAFDDRQWVDGWEYPSSYDTRTWTKVDDLRDNITLQSGSGFTKELEFQGWYLDEACTQAFDGTIDAGTTGTVVLYAKSSVIWWLGPY